MFWPLAGCGYFPGRVGRPVRRACLGSLPITGPPSQTGRAQNSRRSPVYALPLPASLRGRTGLQRRQRTTPRPAGRAPPPPPPPSIWVSFHFPQTGRAAAHSHRRRRESSARPARGTPRHPLRPPPAEPPSRRDGRVGRARVTHLKRGDSRRGASGGRCQQ